MLMLTLRIQKHTKMTVKKKLVKVNSETAEDPLAEISGRNWKISKCVDGNLTYIHIMQALEHVFPHEYISCCRQRRN